MSREFKDKKLQKLYEEGLEANKKFRQANNIPEGQPLWKEPWDNEGDKSQNEVDKEK